MVKPPTSGPLRLPFTLLFILVMLLSNWSAGTLGGALPSAALKAWGLSLEKLLDGEFYRLLTATFLSHSFAMFLRQLVFVAAIVGFYEWSHGTLRTLFVFFTVDVIGTLAVFALVIAPMAKAGGGLDSELAALSDVGMSAGGFGLIGALCRLSPRPWLFLTLTAGAIVLKMAWDIDLIADSAHLICLGLGFVVQALLVRFDMRKASRP